MFSTSSYHRLFVSWAAFPVLLYHVILFSPAAWLYFAAFGVYMILAIVTTIGYHRLFNHKSYDTHLWLHWVFGIIGCIGLNASPFQWSVLHTGHHKYSDTTNDPHENSWRFFFRFKNRQLRVFRNDARLITQPMHKFFMQYSVLLSVIYGLTVYIAGGLVWLSFLYIIPVGFYIIVIGLHTIYSHYRGAPRDLCMMEFLLPMGGEWLHCAHHRTPFCPDFRSKPYHLDLGYYIISLIRTDLK